MALYNIPVSILFEQESMFGSPGSGAARGGVAGALVGGGIGWLVGNRQAKKEVQTFIYQNQLNPNDVNDAQKIKQFITSIRRKYAAGGAAAGGAAGAIGGASDVMAARAGEKLGGIDKKTDMPTGTGDAAKLGGLIGATGGMAKRAIQGGAIGWAMGNAKAKREVADYIKRNNLNPKNPEDQVKIKQFIYSLRKKYATSGAAIGGAAGGALGAAGGAVLGAGGAGVKWSKQVAG